MSNRARDHFSSTLNENAHRINNNVGAHKAKIEIRERVLAEIGPEKAHVLDLYCGAGEMFKGVWHKAASYVGVDQDWFQDERLQYVADNRRVMRAIDLSTFSIVDCDAWGSCYEQLIILAARRQIKPDEKLGLIITDGSGLRLKMGWIPDGLAILSGLRRHMPGVARNHEQIIDRAFQGLCHRMNAKIIKQYRAKGRAASSLWYIGMILQGVDSTNGDLPNH
jgi:hypothetical protein